MESNDSPEIPDRGRHQTSLASLRGFTAKILDLCDKRRELRKKRFEPERSEKYMEVNNNIKRCMKKDKRKLDRRTV